MGGELEPEMYTEEMQLKLSGKVNIKRPVHIFPGMGQKSCSFGRRVRFS